MINKLWKVSKVKHVKKKKKTTYNKDMILDNTTDIY